MKRPIQKIIPLNNLKAELLLHEEVKSIKALWSGKELEFSRIGSIISLTLPLLEDYEVVEITF
jgi:hypothetical protein